MSATVFFIVRSEMQNDLRRIQIKNHCYPLQPHIGSHICFPCVGGIRVAPKVEIVDVEFPASNYFQDSLEMTCYGVLNHQDFDAYYKWLEHLKEEKGLTHQWERWGLFKI